MNEQTDLGEKTPREWLLWLVENADDTTIASFNLGAEVVVAQVAQIGADEIDRLKGEVERLTAWPWSFPPIEMARADALSIAAWNADGPEDERLAETVASLRFNLDHIARALSTEREARALAEGEVERLTLSCNQWRETHEGWKERFAIVEAALTASEEARAIAVKGLEEALIGAATELDAIRRNLNTFGPDAFADRLANIADTMERAALSPKDTDNAG